MMKSQITLKMFKDQVRGKLSWLLLSWGLLLPIALMALTGCVSTVPEEGEQKQVESAAPAIMANKNEQQQAIEAESARYTALADYFAAGEVSPQRAIEAEAARYSGLASFLTVDDEANRPRAIEAETARYSGLAKYFTLQQD
jgi:hypothetical protein